MNKSRTETFVLSLWDSGMSVTTGQHCKLCVEQRDLQKKLSSNRLAMMSVQGINAVSAGKMEAAGLRLQEWRDVLSKC